jgi:hypothetical protein
MKCDVHDQAFVERLVAELDMTKTRDERRRVATKTIVEPVRRRIFDRIVFVVVRMDVDDREELSIVIHGDEME